MATHEHQDDIYVKFSDEGKSATLMREICYDVFGIHYDVPGGTTTDFASIPRMLRFIYPKEGRHRRAAILHDYLYQTGKVSRRVADQIFLEVMRQDGVAYWRRCSMYWGVRLGGWVAYNRYRKEEK